MNCLTNVFAYLHSTCVHLGILITNTKSSNVQYATPRKRSFGTTLVFDSRDNLPKGQSDHCEKTTLISSNVSRLHAPFGEQVEHHTRLTDTATSATWKVQEMPSTVHSPPEVIGKRPPILMTGPHYSRMSPRTLYFMVRRPANSWGRDRRLPQ